MMSDIIFKFILSRLRCSWVLFNNQETDCIEYALSCLCEKPIRELEIRRTMNNLLSRRHVHGKRLSQFIKVVREEVADIQLQARLNIEKSFRMMNVSHIDPARAILMNYIHAELILLYANHLKSISENIVSRPDGISLDYRENWVSYHFFITFGSIRQIVLNHEKKQLIFSFKPTGNSIVFQHGLLFVLICGEQETKAEPINWLSCTPKLPQEDVVVELRRLNLEACFDTITHVRLIRVNAYINEKRSIRRVYKIDFHIK